MAHPTAVIGDPPEDAAWRRSGESSVPPTIAGTATIEAFVSVDAGTEEPGTIIGDRAWLMKHVHVGHDAVIGDRAIIASGAIIGGHAKIGERARIGLGAVILPFREVGAGARVGAGAVVTRNIPPDVKAKGNPATVMVTDDPEEVPFTERDDTEAHVDPPQ